jgi:hypothetical protein
MNAENTPASQPRDGNPRIVSTIVIALAATLQLVVAVPFTVATGLVAPLWAIVIAWTLWVAAAVILVMTARRRPLATPVVPLVNAALLWLLITIGEAALGWTA